MPRRVRSKSRRGTELLDQLVNVLSNLADFDREDDFDFAAILTLLNKYWTELNKYIDGGETRFRGEFIRILKRMATLYRETNKPVSFGVEIFLCHIESFALNGEEVQIVHSITGIHIDRAAAITGANTTAAARIAAARQGELRLERLGRADEVSRTPGNHAWRAMLGGFSRRYRANSITPKISPANSKSSNVSPFAPINPTHSSKR